MKLGSNTLLFFLFCCTNFVAFPLVMITEYFKLNGLESCQNLDVLATCGA